MARGKAVICGSRMVRLLMVLLALGLSIYTVAPAVYWHVVAEDGDVLTKWVLQCPPCPHKDSCKASMLADSASHILAIAQKLNSSLADSKVGNRALREEFGKELEQLLREGLILQNEAKAAQQREDSTGYLDAGKKTVYRNQKGGSGKGAAVNRNEIKETTAANLWEKRAKDLGYKPKPAGYQKYKKYIQMLDG
ncbi:uncharacterized protein [Physcomitrium patens]|uniref:Uncharacterized protein n=1 Tax=Physcomitrium patens TaxID=3218 RepID=A0A2K1JPV3_PHYPA|nr:uncharacterized protein LOC112289294 [Physcomitrium patens]PNR43541.1 hypothetical protein PHYPA_015922 [Physcomitrium patens]|eukprot:XP_024390174.1 uncharacterized protein LOC112289294 [Physcomitrella patens]